MIKAGVIGASGYAGAELVRLLINHPFATLSAISSNSYEGQSLSSLYPSFYEQCNLTFAKAEEVIDQSDVIFASMPHGHSEPLAQLALNKGKKFIDLGADFRLDQEADYEQWYHLQYEYPTLHQKQVYGLTELNREKIKAASLIGNPGCYPTASALGLYPVMKQEWVDMKHIIIDAKSGVTGAGKGLNEVSHFPRCNEAFHAYKAGEHRHTPEIEQTLSKIAKKQVMITFVPHLLPINRGIITTIYADLTENVSLQELHTLYRLTYGREQFVRVLPLGQYADVRFVQMSNFCDISLHMDERNHRLIITSAIDNMVKGAAGQAIQNMNVMCGFEESTGLTTIPASF